MPKQTFLNLPEEKRGAILDVVIDEFAEHGYEGASISRMVSRAGIAKGSFYQYFEDKRDLFLHLVDLVSQEKFAYFKDRQPPDPSGGFFALLRWMFEAGFEFNVARPGLTRAVSRVLLGDGLIYSSMFADLREASSRELTALFQSAIDSGELAPEIDPRVGQFVFETLLNNLGMFILAQQDISPDVLASGDIDWLRSDRAREIIDSLLVVLEHGLRKK